MYKIIGKFFDEDIERECDTPDSYRKTKGGYYGIFRTIKYVFRCL